MGILVLLSALISTISETIRENAAERRAIEEQRRYEDIDWGNIEYVILDGTETAYRIEEEEEFDVVNSYYLSEMNDAPCYATKTVQYEVADGKNYCFTIKYKNGPIIFRKFHENSPLTERLLKYIEEDDVPHVEPITARFNEIIDDSLKLLETTVNPETYFGRYKTALDNAKRMLEHTHNSHYKEYAAEIITDLTQNKTEKHKEFVDRCYFKGMLYSLKDQLLSDKYDITSEAKEYVKSLLEEIETEEKEEENENEF